MSEPARRRAPTLRLHEFGAAYGDRAVLSDVELVLDGPGLYVLMGPSGVGKSTLLRVMTGVAQQNPTLRTWGTMSYLGHSPGEAGWPSLVGQHAHLVVSTVMQNLVGGLAERGRLSQAEQRDHIVAHLAELDCGHLVRRLDDDVVDLPASDQRLVSILRCTIAVPKLLCVDEPTAGFSDTERRAVLGLLKRWAPRGPVLLATHNQKDAREFGDRVALLCSGRIQEFGAPEEMFSKPKSKAAREFAARGTCTSVRPGTPEEELEEGFEPPAPPPAGVVASWSGPRGFVWLQPGRLAGMPRPGIVSPLAHDLDAVQRVGVTRIVTLQQEPLNCERELRRRSLVAVHFPIVDMEAPGAPETLELCRRIDDWLRDGEVVAVHCRAGHGRTGTILAAWRIHHGLTAPDAIEDVRRQERRWIQSQEQAEFLQRFESWLLANAGSEIAKDPPHPLQQINQE